MARRRAPAGLPQRYRVIRHETLDSTNAEALRSTARAGDVIVADVQTAGRGRSGRIWRSPPGNLYASIVCDVPADRNPAQLAFVAALAVLDTIADLAPVATLSLKWPNDILGAGRKMAGILIEAGERGHVVGIGINLRSAPPDDDVRYPAVSLRSLTNVDVAPADAIGPLCHAFERWHGIWTRDGFAPVRTAWLASGHRMGDTIAASAGAADRDQVRIEGRFAGLTADGALLVDVNGGTRHTISAGDVIFSGVR